jgi:peptidoglycan/LPS O-acetylase OafA/YrhL
MQHDATSMGHRADLDGLRCLAVLPITFFHAGIPGFGGGFVGVDIFFVISGFLITRIIDRDVTAGRFSYGDFYERRIRRIFPALIGMLTACIAAAYYFVLPTELHGFALSVLGTLLFASNIVFWRQSGYFDANAYDKPLLHTWSLGVEEQFYIGFPIILAVIIRHFPAQRRSLVALLAVVSLVACIVLTPIKPMATFYLIPTRAWELLAGSLIALGAVPSVRSRFVREIAAACGIILIMTAIILFDPKTSFPGVAAMLPVGGAVLIVAYAPGTRAGQLLAFRPFAFVGLISYSLYLWHWPLIVFARRLPLPGTALDHAVGLVIVSLIVGYLSWKFIETPFRNRSRFARKHVFGFAAASGAILLTVGGAFALSKDGLVGRRFSPEVLAYDAGRLDFSPERGRCHPDQGLAPPEKACVFGGKVEDTAVWGDSHGIELAYALGSPVHPLRSLTYSRCSPAMGLNVPGRPACVRHNALVLDYLTASTRIRTVILASYFAWNLENPHYRRGMLESIRALQRSGKTVFLLGPTPAEVGEDLPHYLLLTGNHEIRVQDYRTRQASTIRYVRWLERSGVRVLWPSDAFCSTTTCRLTVGDRPILFDGHHLSVSAARDLARRFTPLIWPSAAP